MVMGMDTTVEANNAKSRGEIYGLLAAVFRQEPSKAFVKELRGPGLSRVFSDMDIKLGDSFYTAPEDKVVEELTVEYSRLFIGPGHHISAHESVFHEIDGDSGGLWGKCTVEVKKFIETTGLFYQSAYTGLPDHISVELEFMQSLSMWEADKWRHEDCENAEYVRSVQRMFLDKHMLRWVPQFCAAVATQAQLPFYREMAELTRQYMEFEQQNIN